MAIIDLKVPDIGGSSDVNIAEVYIKAGDKIQKDDNLLMLETDKATMEVPAEFAGTVKEVMVKVGGRISQGDLILKLEVADSEMAGAPAKPKEKPETVAIVNATSENKPIINTQAVPSNAISSVAIDKSSPAKSETVKNIVIDEVAFSKAFASPSIRKLARELGADLGKIKGTGAKGRITEVDVKSYVKGVLTSGSSLANGGGLDLLPWPKIDFTKFGEVEVKELSRIRKISGANLLRNWVMIPHVTQFDEADITDLEEFRKNLNEEYKKDNIKITPMAFLIKACVYALKEYPEFNSSIDGGNLIYKKYFNIGFAADTPQGLVVPVLKDADKKGLIDIASETSELAKLAREGKLKPTDMQGGTFTISSLGGIGGTAFTPIINAPEVAILGVSKSSIKPIWDGKEFLPKLMLPLSLSYDHRIIDGALAARFSSYLSKVLSDIRRLTL
jgi:pyruvate dehydrogenase E2 component (dihydrolipoamide acetyltransferase)